jgi:Mg-chelatase subunit ChlD
MLLQEPAFEAHLAHRFGVRSRMVLDLRKTEAFLAQVSPGQIEYWRRQNLQLYSANAGADVMIALWSLQRAAQRGTPDSDMQRITDAVYQICLSGGARNAVAAIGLAERFFQNSAPLKHVVHMLEAVTNLARRAPECIRVFLRQAPGLFARIDAEDVVKWVSDGLNLYPDSKLKKQAYFCLDDAKARSQLAHYEGTDEFSSYEPWLKHLVRCLWQIDISLQSSGTQSVGSYSERVTLCGRVVVVPNKVPDRFKHNRADFFEAAVLHAAAHARFTRQRFPIRGMKPVQIALTSLIEDARVERLAAREYPGLGRLWLRQHSTPSSAGSTVAQTPSVLFSLLARALADPEFVCADSWVMKGKRLFDTAFLEAPDDQFLAEGIARVLGNDLGQMRIPFDAKSYRVEPSYRDDGLGLFEFDDADDREESQLEIVLDAARAEPEKSEDEFSGNEPDDAGEGAESARMKRSAMEDQRCAVLGLFPEWDNILQREQTDFVTVRERMLTPRAAPNWLTERLSDYKATAAQIRGLARQAQFGRTETSGRRLDGDMFDLDAAISFMVALHQGMPPDPRVYVRQRRARNDVALGLLLDTSQSTGNVPQGSQETVLQMAVIATALLVEGLQAAGDKHGVFAFSSDGRHDVQLASIQGFEEEDSPVLERLADLQPGLSTRLGAAIRYVSGEMLKQKTRRKVMIVLTDGEPSDVDVEDPADLSEDARRAIAMARSQGVDLFCIPFGQAAQESSGAIFGPRNTLPLMRIEDLPARLSALYFKVTG